MTPDELKLGSSSDNLPLGISVDFKFYRNSRLTQLASGCSTLTVMMSMLLY